MPIGTSHLSPSLPPLQRSVRFVLFLVILKVVGYAISMTIFHPDTIGFSIFLGVSLGLVYLRAERYLCRVNGRRPTKAFLVLIASACAGVLTYLGIAVWILIIAFEWGVAAERLK